MLAGEPGRDLRSFRVAAVSPAGTKRGTGRGAFIDSVLGAETAPAADDGD